jgi:hypothetical protein
MGMLMFNALLSLLVQPAPWMMLLLLCFTSLVTGMLARLMQPYHGIGSALAAGLVAALIILFLWQSARAEAGIGMVFGPAGILAPVVFSTFGAWLLPYLRIRGKSR